MTTNDTTTNDNGQAKALARVRKMLNLANNEGATEGERDAAMSQVYSILAKYNLSMADAEAAGTQQEEKRTNLATPGRSFAWARTVAYAIARMCFCSYYYVTWQNGQKMRHHYIGKESNAVTASEMANYVIASINREAGARARREFRDGRWERDFCKGAASRIHYRCEELRRQAEEQSKPQPAQSNGRELVLASLYKTELQANEEWLKAQNINLRAGRGRERGAGADAYEAGAAFGNSVSLNRQVGRTSSNTKLIK